MKNSRIPTRNLQNIMSDIETTSLDQISLDDESESDTVSAENKQIFVKQKSGNRIKVIPIQVKPTMQAPPSETSTTSTIEDLLAEKVERIANHLEMANTNILSVGGKLNGIRDDTHHKGSENIEVLTQLRNQIDGRLQQQNTVNSKLSRHIKDLSKTVNQRNHIKLRENMTSQPVLIPPHSMAHTFPPPGVIVANETTDAFLDRIRREANDRVDEAIRVTEHRKEKEETIDKLRQFLEDQAREKDEITKLTEKSDSANNLQSAKAEVRALKAQLKNAQKLQNAQNTQTLLDHQNAENAKIAAETAAYQAAQQQQQKAVKDAEAREAVNNSLAQKSALEMLTNERAELENKVFSLSRELHDMKAEHAYEIRKLSDRYEHEISDYRDAYDHKFKELNHQTDKIEKTQMNKYKTEIKQLQRENEKMGGQLGILGHELDKRDMELADLSSSLMLHNAQGDSENNTGRLFDKTLLGSISSILVDLGASSTILKNEYLSNQELRKMIVDELLKAVEKVRLAEEMKANSDVEVLELKAKIRKLLERIDREKQLVTEKKSLKNEQAFQDTIQALQRELNKTRRKMKTAKVVN